MHMDYSDEFDDHFNTCKSQDFMWREFQGENMSYLNFPMTEQEDELTLQCENCFGLCLVILLENARHMILLPMFT